MKMAIAGLMIACIMLTVMTVEVKASSEDDILAYMNDARAEAGLPALVYDETLKAAADTRAKECAQKFSHTRSDGKAWYTVSKFTNGENLAHAENSNQSKAENVVLAWLLSSKHKDNVLRAGFSAVGISYYYDAGGHTYVACEFR